jgi:hypothetical protein
MDDGVPFTSLTRFITNFGISPKVECREYIGNLARR